MPLCGGWVAHRLDTICDGMYSVVAFSFACWYSSFSAWFIPSPASPLEQRRERTCPSLSPNKHGSAAQVHAPASAVSAAVCLPDAALRLLLLPSLPPCVRLRAPCRSAALLPCPCPAPASTAAGGAPGEGLEGAPDGRGERPPSAAASAVARGIRAPPAAGPACCVRSPPACARAADPAADRPAVLPGDPPVVAHGRRRHRRRCCRNFRQLLRLRLAARWLGWCYWYC